MLMPRPEQNNAKFQPAIYYIFFLKKNGPLPASFCLFSFNIYAQKLTEEDEIKRGNTIVQQY